MEIHSSVSNTSSFTRNRHLQVVSNQSLVFWHLKMCKFFENSYFPKYLCVAIEYWQGSSWKWRPLQVMFWVTEGLYFDRTHRISIQVGGILPIWMTGTRFLQYFLLLHDMTATRKQDLNALVVVEKLLTAMRTVNHFFWRCPAI